MYDTIHLTFPRRYDIDTYLQLNIRPGPYLLLDDGLHRGGLACDPWTLIVTNPAGYSKIL